jgi:hypothetical protein
MTRMEQWKGRGKWRWGQRWRQPNKIRKVKNLGQFHISSRLNRRSLGSSPAQSNECFELELPGAWEPPDSSYSPPFGASEETQFGLPHGDQTVMKEGGISENKTGI